MATTFTPFPDLGNAVPEFKLPAVDGKTYSLKDFSNGKPLVVMFICAHCPYVQAVEERLITLGADLKKDGVNVVGICSNDPKDHPEDSFDALAKRWKEKNYSFTYLVDESQDVAKAFGAVCTPDFFVYDGGLKLVYRGRLDNSWKDASKVTQRELYDAVQTLLRNQKVTEEQTASMGCSIKWK
ncbi:thioredoxin family protein [Bdellovibrio sp. HCB185ZH]|uniref:thioredoxin family protein n=1 Tax=Bdellovibrio sp. HCB185ZH TaxID=3394235 RepID=UPI0039A565A3